MLYWLTKEVNFELIEIGAAKGFSQKLQCSVTIAHIVTEWPATPRGPTRCDVWCWCVCSIWMWLRFAQAWLPAGCHLGGEQDYLDLNLNSQNRQKVNTLFGSWGHTRTLCLSWKLRIILLFTRRPTNNTTTIRNFESMSTRGTPIIWISPQTESQKLCLRTCLKSKVPLH